MKTKKLKKLLKNNYSKEFVFNAYENFADTPLHYKSKNLITTKKNKNMETEIRIKPIKKIIVENLYPYDFLNYFYTKTFGLEGLFLNIEECQDYNYLFNEIIKKWEEVDSYNDEEFKCKVYYENKIFTHNTVSDRFIIYDYSKLLLTIDFCKEGSKEGSSTFAYQILSNLAPLMQPEKWRGLGGGNLSFDGKIKKQFKIYVTF